jgi:AraC-like DNA-binding protein
MLRRILTQIERDLKDPLLSPASLAGKLGISVRYVHKLFAMEGRTCLSHISERRLLRARSDLLSADNKLRISTLGYHWGFSDPSSFGRAFRKRFGCSPRRLRDIERR